MVRHKTKPASIGALFAIMHIQQPHHYHITSHQFGVQIILENECYKERREQTQAQTLSIVDLIVQD